VTGRPISAAFGFYTVIVSRFLLGRKTAAADERKLHGLHHQTAHDYQNFSVFTTHRYACQTAKHVSKVPPDHTWYGMVNVDVYSAIITKVSNVLNTLVSGEKPGFQALSIGLIVLLCTEVVRQGVPDHGAVHSEC